MPAAAASVRLPLRLLLIAVTTLSLSSTLTSAASQNEALLQLKKSFGESGNILDTWVSDSNPCDDDGWTGIICSKGIVTGIRLQDIPLSGTIDVEALQELSGLRTVAFVNSSFSGEIPEFKKLGALKALFLSKNQFSGSISDDFFSQMNSLKKLWLSDNRFTGKIPISLMKLPHLLELHLEGNEFSGEIPQLKQPQVVLTSLNLSNNKLQGEIPESLSKFGPSTFSGNNELCGKPLKECPKRESGFMKNIWWIAAGVIAGIIFFVTIAVLFLKRKKHDDFSELGKEVVEVHVPAESNAASRRAISATFSTKKVEPKKKGSSKGVTGDLVMVNDEKGSFGLPDLMKAAAEVLGNGGLGSSYKAMMESGLSVVVKRVKEMNAVELDAFDVEMRRLGKLRHSNILTPLAYHYRREEKLVVSEYMPKGSLLFVLHGDRGISHAELNWPNRLKVIKGIAKGLEFLHSEFSSYELPHGNLKSSNILLNNDYEPLLNDYAFHPLLNPSHAECMFAFKSPEFIEHKKISPMSDVYCFGIIILEILTGKFPSQYLSNSKGGIDVLQWVQSAICEGKETELIDPEISNNENSLRKMIELLKIGVSCCESNPEQRLDMKEVVRRIDEALV